MKTYIRYPTDSLHNGDPIMGPLKPLNTIVLWCSEGFQDGWNSIGPRDASLSTSYTCNQCCFYIGMYIHVFGSVLFSDFVNSNDCIGKITSDYNQFLFKTRFEVHKKQIFFSSEKMRNLGKCIYDYSQSFFGNDFKPKPILVQLIYWEEIKT